MTDFWDTASWKYTDVSEVRTASIVRATCDQGSGINETKRVGERLRYERNSFPLNFNGTFPPVIIPTHFHTQTTYRPIMAVGLVYD
jgi:hypothetical protein